MSHNIPGASVRTTVDGTRQIFKLKVRNPIPRPDDQPQSKVTFSLRPITGTVEEYHAYVTCHELPGLFKNSGSSSFGPFVVKRFPGRNAIERPKSLAPTAGNAVMMWPHLNDLERGRCYEFLEKLLRSDLPKIEVKKPVGIAA